jgi:hypothetical protein
MYKKIAQFGALAVLIGSGGGLWSIEQYIDYAPGLNPSPIAIAKKSQLASSALGDVGTSNTGVKGEEYYIKNSEQIDADFIAMQAKIQEIARTRYPLMANNCDMKRIQENFDGNEKIDRTICKPNRVAGVIANRFLDNLFAYPDNRPVMEEVIAVKWALVSADNANNPEAQATKADLREYQIFLNDFVTTQYTNLQKKKETVNFNNSLTKGKYLGLEIAFLFAEQEKLIVDYILGQ